MTVAEPVSQLSAGHACRVRQTGTDLYGQPGKVSVRIRYATPESALHTEASQPRRQIQGLLVAARLVPTDQTRQRRGLVAGHAALAAFRLRLWLAGTHPTGARKIERLTEASIRVVAVVMPMDGDAMETPNQTLYVSVQ